MNVKETRKVRGYKITDSAYKRAQKRGIKDGEPLATLIEKVVTAYSKGWNLGVFDHSETYASQINKYPVK